jgi:hypothetical protein
VSTGSDLKGQSYEGGFQDGKGQELS